MTYDTIAMFLIIFLAMLLGIAIMIQCCCSLIDNVESQEDYIDID